MKFDWAKIRDEDRWFAKACGVTARDPDLTIAPDGSPYLYRWHLIPRNNWGNNYLHIQVASDPERPLHDHPWDNTSVILSGGYTEIMSEHQNLPSRTHKRVKGDVVNRLASHAHRLILPPDIPYTMTLFTTGPTVRDWGFWINGWWVSHKEVLTNLADGRSVFKMPEEFRDDN